MNSEWTKDLNVKYEAIQVLGEIWVNVRKTWDYFLPMNQNPEAIKENTDKFDGVKITICMKKNNNTISNIKRLQTWKIAICKVNIANKELPKLEKKTNKKKWLKYEQFSEQEMQ